MVKRVKELRIVGKRWFQKSFGNTYHSVEIWVNNEKLYVPFAYGYGNQFLETARAELVRAGYLVDLENYYNFVDFVRCHGSFDVIDVERKKDL